MVGSARETSHIPELKEISPFNPVRVHESGLPRIFALPRPIDPGLDHILSPVGVLPYDAITARFQFKFTAPDSPIKVHFGEGRDIFVTPLRGVKC